MIVRIEPPILWPCSHNLTERIYLVNPLRYGAMRFYTSRQRVQQNLIFTTTQAHLPGMIEIKSALDSVHLQDSRGNVTSVCRENGHSTELSKVQYRVPVGYNLVVISYDWRGSDWYPEHTRID